MWVGVATGYGTGAVVSSPDGSVLDDALGTGRIGEHGDTLLGIAERGVGVEAGEETGVGISSPGASVREDALGEGRIEEPAGSLHGRLSAGGRGR